MKYKTSDKFATLYISVNIYTGELEITKNNKEVKRISPYECNQVIDNIGYKKEMEQSRKSNTRGMKM